MEAWKFLPRKFWGEPDMYSPACRLQRDSWPTLTGTSLNNGWARNEDNSRSPSSAGKRCRGSCGQVDAVGSGKKKESQVTLKGFWTRGGQPGCKDPRSILPHRTWQKSHRGWGKSEVLVQGFPKNPQNCVLEKKKPSHSGCRMKLKENQDD